MQRESRRTVADFLRPPFLVAVAMLAAAALLAGPIAAHFDMTLAKEPLPLKKPLSMMDTTPLYPYRVVERHVLDPIMVEALGTDEYLSWTLEDTSVAADDPLRLVNLLITYYTGGANLVPHVPDVCYLGSGYAPAQPHENRDIPLHAEGIETDSLPVRLCTFVRTSVFQGRRVSVVYTFMANGQLVSTRTGVRLAINDPTDTHAYFSKVEVSFPHATRQQCLEGSRRILQRVLPILRRDHWRDFAAAEAAEPDADR